MPPFFNLLQGVKAQLFRYENRGHFRSTLAVPTGQRYTMPSLDALKPAMELVCAELAKRKGV